MIVAFRRQVFRLGTGAFVSLIGNVLHLEEVSLCLLF